MESLSRTVADERSLVPSYECEVEGECRFQRHFTKKKNLKCLINNYSNFILDEHILDILRYIKLYYNSADLLYCLTWLLGNGMTDSLPSGYSSFALDILVQEACCQVTNLALWKVQSEESLSGLLVLLLTKRKHLSLREVKPLPISWW